MNILWPLTKALSIPLLFFIAGLLLAESLPGLPVSWFPLVQGLPYVLLAASALLCIQFNQSRMIFTLLCLSIFYGALHWELFPLSWLHVNLFFLLLLFNIALLGQVRERSVLSLHSVTKIIFGLLQLLIVWILLGKQQATLIEWFSKEWFAITLPSFIGVSQFMLVFIVLAGLALLIRVLRQPGPIESAILVSFVMLAYLLNSSAAENVVVAVVIMAAIMCFVAVLFDSHQMAYRDELTGLRSRRALNQFITGLGRNYTIAMMDIDHFKPFNDNHGHDIGDQMLKLVASRIARVKGGGTAFRYGGEEFTVIFPRKDCGQVEPYLEELRKSIENYPLHVRAKNRPAKAPKAKEKQKAKDSAAQVKTLSCTISIGIASRSEQHKTPEEVMKAADTALYRAKKRGRNCLSQ